MFDETIDLNEFSNLTTLLTLQDISFTTHSMFNGAQVRGINGTWDVICHSGSYGHEQGLLEYMGYIAPYHDIDDTVVGYLTADEALIYIKEDEERKKANEKASRDS